MPRHRNVQCFLTKTELKDAKIKIKREKYRTLMSEINRRILIDVILDTKEGFILPYRLGVFRLYSRRMSHGIMLKRTRRLSEPFVLNSHTFGKCYFIKWDMRINGAIRRQDTKDTYPAYKGEAMRHFPFFAFRLANQHKSLLKYKIENNLLKDY
jgi:hypothetical protein